MSIRIGLGNFAEVYKFPHSIGAISSMISGQNRPNETLYPNVRDLRCPYNSTMGSQGLKHKNWEETKSPQHDDTKSSQKKNMARTRPRKQGLKRGQKLKA